MGSRGRSVVDYILASQSLFTCVKELKVHDPSILSGPCIISCSFDFKLKTFYTQTEKTWRYVVNTNVKIKIRVFYREIR